MSVTRSSHRQPLEGSGARVPVQRLGLGVVALVSEISRHLEGVREADGAKVVALRTRRFGYER